MIETKSIDEVIPATFDYTDETLVPIVNQVITLTVMKGIDAGAAAMIQGAAQANAGVVIQLLKDGVIDCQYNAHCLAIFADGSKLARDYKFRVVAAGY